MEGRSFETEVLSRLAVIENKLDASKDTKQKAEVAYLKSNEHENRIKKMEDSNTWLWRTFAGAFISGFFGIVILYIKIGMGLK